MSKTALALCAVLLGCSYGTPAKVKPVTGFERSQYLGTWYEIARLDHSFERGLEQVTANYALRDDGGVKVTNRGFDTRKKAWKEAVGKAYFVGQPDTGHLKVSFFGPFYGSYVVFELGEGYDYAFVSGSNTGYLWLLARTPTISEALKTRFIKEAEKRGFDPQALIFVKQRPSD